MAGGFRYWIHRPSESKRRNARPISTSHRGKSRPSLEGAALQDIHTIAVQHRVSFYCLPITNFIPYEHAKCFICNASHAHCRFHWVLLLFDLEACTVNVYDSMDKKESMFDKVFELIDRYCHKFLC